MKKRIKNYANINNLDAIKPIRMLSKFFEVRHNSLAIIRANNILGLQSNTFLLRMYNFYK